MIVKYILNTDLSTLKIFLQNKPSDFISLLFNMAIGNNYHNIDEYKPSVDLLNLIINNKQLNKINYGN